MDREDPRPLRRGRNAIINHNIDFSKIEEQRERDLWISGSGGGHARPVRPWSAPMYPVLRLPTIHLGESRRGRGWCPRPRGRVALCILIDLSLGEMSVPVTSGNTQTPCRMRGRHPTPVETMSRSPRCFRSAEWGGGGGGSAVTTGRNKDPAAVFYTVFSSSAVIDGITRCCITW